MDARTFPMHQAGRRLSTQSGPRACTQLGVDVHPLSKAELGWPETALLFLGTPQLNLAWIGCTNPRSHEPPRDYILTSDIRVDTKVMRSLSLFPSAPRQTLAGDIGNYPYALPCKD